MTAGRRMPGPGILAVLLFIALPLAATGWWLYRPPPDGEAPPPDLADLDVVCAGRVDGLLPTVSLEPGLPGRVRSIDAKEGEAVAEGRVLLRLDDSAANLRLDEARAAALGAEAERDAALAEAKLQPGRIAAAEAMAAATAARAEAARQLQAQRRAQQAVTKASGAELAAGEAEVRQYEQVEVAERERLKEVRAADPNLKVRIAGARVAAVEVAVRTARKAVEDCAMRSPAKGTVLRVQAGVGEAVAPGGAQPPVLFRPDGPLVVRAELEQEYLGRVRPGTRATVRDETRPNSPTWTGRLVRVSDWIARRRSIVFEPGELNDVRTAECLVSLDPSPETLLVGQRVRVRFARLRE